MGFDTQSRWFQNVTAQVAHFGAAFAIIAVFMLRLPHYSHYGIVGMFVYAGLKEFWYDANYEKPKQSSSANVLDFSMYVAGIVSAFFTCRGF